MKKLFLLLLIPLLWFSCSPEDTSNITITLDKPSITLIIGKTVKLTATVANTKNKAISWSTSNDSIASVSGAGIVTAVAEGTATIKVTSKADSSKTAECIVTVNPRPITDIGAKDGLSGKTSEGYFEEKNVYIGWNLGNAFDAGDGYGSWTRKIDKDFLPKIKEAGFSMVRIPVTWNINARPIGDAPDYQLNQTTLNELVQVVDWAYDAGLVTIINIHHDGNAYYGWLSINNLKDPAKRDAITDKFVKVWEQIADKFKDYGDWLIFEPFNELHNGGWGWGDIADVEYEIINDLNQKFTDTVRAAGGKNTERFLVVQPLCAKPHQAIADTFVLPTDSAAGKQIVSMHYYDPEEFALRGSGSAYEWGSEGDRTRLSSDFESYADKFTKKGIPVILGESGATYQNRSDTAQRLTAAACRLVYMEYMCQEAKKNGIVPVYWDNVHVTL
jgi:aryl-phospho-beta-D-glucosidase BglC (GH1 family)